MAGAAQLFVERPFFVRDGGGHDDFQLQEEISLLAGRGREPLALEAQFTVGFATGGNFHLHRFRQGRSHHFSAQRRLPWPDRKGDLNIESLLPKDAVGLDMDAQIEVSRFASIDAGLSLARQADTGLILHTGRNAYFDRAFFSLGAGTTAHDTGPAPHDGAAAAGLAYDAFSEIDAPGDPAQDVADAEVDVGFQVLPIDRKPRSRSATGSSAEEGLEDITEVAAESAGLAASSCLGAGLLARLLIGFRLFPVRAVLVVFLSLVRVRQHLVRFVQFFELLLHLRFFCAGMEIGMDFTGAAAKGLLDVVGRRVPWHTEDVVITALRCGHQGLSVENHSMRADEECNPFRSLRGLRTHCKRTYGFSLPPPLSFMKEIREPGAQSSGRGGGWIETAVVDEQVPSATCFGER